VPREAPQARGIGEFYAPDPVPPRRAAPQASGGRRQGVLPRPGFFLVGAPRCGTTTLGRTLARHPQVCFSDPKETNFFLPARRPVSRRDLERYLRRHFRHLAPGHRILGEGSVSYLYFPEALGEILRWDAKARFVVAARNPVDMIPSYHARMLYHLHENEPDLARAWDLQERRAQGECLPRKCHHPLLLQYRHIGSLGSRLRELFARVGRERCFVVLFDDLIAEPLGVYRRLLEFLGVEDDGRTSFRHKNANREFRWRWLQPFVMNPPRPLAALATYRHLPAVRAVRRRIKRFNTRRVARPPVDPGMHKTLQEAFHDEVELLSRLLDRDLGHWR